MQSVKTQYANTLMNPPRDKNGVEDTSVIPIWTCQTWELGEKIIEGVKIERFPVTITAWRPSPEDIAMQLKGGLLFTTFYGHSLPPQRLAAESPFMGEQEQNKDSIENNALLHLYRALLNKVGQAATVNGDMSRVETKDGVTRVTFANGKVATLMLADSLILSTH